MDAEYYAHIFLHKQASVKQATSMDLSDRKVIMFSTHGLVPGELNGLTQLALAPLISRAMMTDLLRNQQKAQGTSKAGAAEAGNTQSV
ncbi:hypothetical protein [Polynucleobacter necessarius]|uniref:hypothetical protein n=1 Tax=Polynucleobacter necessarius TaxID=576610 RepID=UPI000E090F00|nr:hypothetical protein [Polynucleobacter necessarius]HAT39720.1 hypothetical protein [Polynucleobacter sp.]